ncbi:MAG: TMEM175 family protein [Stenotrophobium sp.]
MGKGRLEAFSDGVIAVIITIMVLEMRVPQGADFAALKSLLPVFLSYVLSFVYIGIYWNNHHHLLHATKHINGRIMWANLNLLFWESLVPFATAWMGENHFAQLPVAVYGVALLMPGLAWLILQHEIIALDGDDSLLAIAVGNDLKGKLSMLLYVAAIALAFVNRWISCVLYVVVALMWLVPDRRIESRIKE